MYAKNPKTGKVELAPVVALFNRQTHELMEIEVDGTVVTVTSDHPFYVPGEGWVASGKLRVSDKLRQLDGDTVTITRITHRAADTTVYNFEVDGLHSYYAGAAQLLVHNSNCIVGRRGSPMDVPRGTNSPATIGGREYSGHALDQMQGRGLVPSVVENVIEHGSATASRDGTTVHVFEGVQVVVDTGSGRVVTVIG